MSTRRLHCTALLIVLILTLTPTLTHAQTQGTTACPPETCTLPGGACGVPRNDLCLTCEEASGGTLCARPNNTCGYACDVSQCGSYFNQCIDPSWFSCIEEGGCIRSSNTCGYYCTPGSVCEERNGQCIDAREAACLEIPCDWIDGECNCKRTCLELGCWWSEEAKICDCITPCMRKGCIWMGDEGCDCATPCVQKGCQWNEESQVCDCSKQPPEPMTIVLMGTGLAVFGVARKLRHRKPQSPAA